MTTMMDGNSETMRTLLCATPTGSMAAPKGKPEPKGKAPKASKLPVPPPKSKASVSAPTIPDSEDIPTFLKVENRVPLSAEHAAKLKASTEQARLASTKATRDAAAAEVAAEQKAKKALKAAVGRETAQAAKAGATAAMPPQGKAAVAVIKTGAPLGSAADAQVKAGRSNVVEHKKPKASGAKPKPVAKPKPAPKKATAKKAPKGTTKLALVAALLTRKQGCTSADVLKATGWPAVSMPQQAKAAGLKLTKEKTKGTNTRYFGK